MGVYLCCIVVATVVLRIEGDYCLLESRWRASVFCAALGVLFSISAHGSLFSVALVSVIRWINCSRVDTAIRTKSIVIGSALVLFLNLAHAILPLLPVSYLQDIFRTEIFIILHQSGRESIL